MNILYAGDKDNAPAYIEGALVFIGQQVTHISPYEPLPELAAFDVIVLSDYPASMVSAIDAEAIAAQVASGKRLVMVGGWESFNGFGRNYAGHPLERLLPVTLTKRDDRVNAWQGLILHAIHPHTSRDNPEWTKPPIICGYNHAVPKHHAEVLVEMRPIMTTRTDVKLGSSLPLVIRSAFQSGTVIACLTDLAPHWSGGLTDWGAKRVYLQTGVEVGESFLKFVQYILEV